MADFQIVEPEGWNGQIVEPEGWDGVIVEPEAQSQTAPAAVPVAAPRPNNHRILTDGTPINIDTGEADWDGFNNPGGSASLGESLVGNFKAAGNDLVANVGGAIQAAAEESLANPLGHGGKEGWRRPLSEDELQRKQEYWEPVKETGEQMHRFSRELAEDNVPENQSTGGKFAGDVVRAGVGSLLPMIGAGIATGGSSVPLAFMGSQVYGGTYADARAAGRSEDEANQDALFSTAAELITEKVPLEYLLKPGGRFLEAALKGSVLEGAQEGFVSVLQSMYDAGALPENGTFGDAVAALGESDTWKEALYSAAVGGVLGASVAGPMGELQYQSDVGRYKAERGDLAQGAIKPLPVDPGGNGEVVRTPVEPIPDETIDFIENEPVSSPVVEAQAAPVVDPAPESVVYPSAIPAQPKIIEADLPDKDKPDDELDAQRAPAAPVEIVEPEGFDFGGEETIVTDTGDSDVTLIDPDQIQVDAKTFQFKSQTDDEGLSDQLRGTKQWDSTASGVSVVWENTNGDQFIVDGHQRLGLAKRLKAEGQSPKIRAFVLKEVDGVSAGEARKIGAIKNLQEGGESTSAIDVAKVMRDGAAIDDIADVVPPNRSAFRDGKGLAKLGEHSFGLVVNEEIDPGHAAIVGDLIADHQEQVAAITVLQRVSPQNNDQARMVVEQTVRAGFEKRVGDSQGDMFGTESMVDDLVGERVKVLDSTLKRLKSMKRVFNSAVLNQAALESAGNVIDAQSSKTQVTDNARTIENIARLANTTGPISEALDAAARQVQSGVAVPVAVNGFLEGISGSQGNSQENNRSREKSKGRVEPPPEPVSEPVSKQPQAPSSEGVSDSGESIPDKSSVDSQAHEAATSSENDLPSPTESQIEAGTYKKGHPVINGLQISIENPAGSKRRPEWPTLKSHYGYVKGVPARAPDKEHVDVFVKPGTEEGFSGDVFVIDQFHANGKFDEPKVMIGYAGEAEAQSAYQENFTKDWKGGKPATRLTMDEFKTQLLDAQGFMEPIGKSRATPVKKPAPTEKSAPVKTVTGTFSASDTAVKGHRQSASINGDTITVASHAGRKKTSQFSFPLTEWQAAEKGPSANENFNRLELIRAKVKENPVAAGDVTTDTPPSDSLDDRVIDSIISAIKKAGVRANKSVVNALAAVVEDQTDKGQDSPSTTNQEPSNAPTGKTTADGSVSDSLDPPSRPTLAGASADDVRADGGGGLAGAGTSQGGSIDPQRPGGDAGLGDGIPDGLGDGEGTVSVSGAGSRDGGSRAGNERDHEGDNGTSGTDAGNERAELDAGYEITSETGLGAGGAKTRYKSNIAAIKIVKAATDEQRPATPEEKATLAKYSGWGSLSQAFPRPDGTTAKGWETQTTELKETLTESEYAAARRSTQDAHYTSETVVGAIYDALIRFGVTGTTQILEPAMGTGNFVGLMPANLRSGANVSGVELDVVTGGVAKLLYPKANIQTPKGFQEVNFPSDMFDVVIGNPPFGDQKLFDVNHKDISKFSIHNFFFAKAIETTRPGGIVAMVVSRYLMDSQSSAARAWMSKRAHFLGAIRLPNTAFKSNAGTEVVTDIIFLQKLDEIRGGTDAWVNSTGDGNGNSLNNYFKENPRNILGRNALTGSMYRDNEYTVEPTGELGPQLAEAVSRLPENVYQPAGKTIEQAKGEEIAANEETKVFGFFVDSSGNIRTRLPDSYSGAKLSEKAEGLSERAVDRIKGMLRITGALRKMIAMEMDQGATDKALAKQRELLNVVYDTFVKKNGFLNEEGNRRAMTGDPEYPLLLSLEKDYVKKITPATAKKTGEQPKKATAAKGDIFTQRVIPATISIESVDSPVDALAVSLNESGRVDIARMAALASVTENEIITELGDLIYQDPVSGWVTAEEYLSGNVKRKLREAIAAGGEYRGNAAALEAVQPAPIDPVDIAVKLSAPWISNDVIEDFVDHLIEGTAEANFNAPIGRWEISITGANPAKNNGTWGAGGKSAADLIMALMKNKAIKITFKDADGNTHTDQEATDAATAKSLEITEEFKAWIWEDGQRRAKLSKIYNDKHNTNVKSKHNGDHLTFPGMSSGIIPRKHQGDAVWRMIKDGVTLLDHVVGSGKTYTMASAAMEMRRMGVMKKPLFVVPNHLIEQWATEFYELYPAAKLLTATKKDFTPKNRKQLLARIATGDWDSVIISHSAFGFISSDPSYEAAFFDRMVAEIEAGIASSKVEDKRTLSQLEKQKDRIKAKVQAAQDRLGKDDLLTFEQLGVDGLFVDEAHEFKNLFYSTSRQRVAGLGDTNGSQKAMGMFLKIQSILERNSQRGVFLATGTPISNSMAEMFTMQRYLDMENMRERGLAHFDAWADTFGDAVPKWSLDSTGVKYKLQTRFNSFVNVPELMQLYSSFADTVSLSFLKSAFEAQGLRWPVPKIVGGVPQNIVVDRSLDQAVYMDEIVARASNMPSDPTQDNFLKLTSDARKAGLDMRLVDPLAEDSPTSKVNEAVGRILELNKAWASDKGTQLVFIDLSTPKKALDKERKKIIDLQDLAAAGDESAIRTLGKMSMDEILAVQSSFSVYDDLKQKLIAGGMSNNEVAFIHDANTDKQRGDLFAKVKSGRVRVLIGSTAKMGAGMNVQERLVGLHHLDAPWRPSDLEQREGRIIRQGNKLYQRDPEGFYVEINRYATEKTYDARMWQTIEGKAGFIEQVRNGETGRSMDDIVSEAANAAEMKAAASGNPLILEQVELAQEIKTLQASQKSANRSRHQMESRLTNLERDGGPAARGAKRIDAAQALIKIRDENTPSTGVRIDGTLYEKAKKAGSRIESIVANAVANQLINQDGGTHDLFSYRGFDIEFDKSFLSGFEISINHEGSPVGGMPSVYGGIDEFSGSGLITRLNNQIDGLEEGVEVLKSDIKDAEKEITQIKAELKTKRKFTGEAELAEKRERMAEVLAELSAEEEVDNATIDTPLHSKGESVSTGITKEEAVSAIEVKAGKGTIDRLGDDIFIPNTRAELEAGMLDRGFSAEELIFSDETQAGDPLDDSKGFYDPSTDTTYLLPFNMQSVDEAWPIFVHEVGTHYGLERILGKSKYNSLIEDVEIMVRGGSPKILAAMRHVNLFEGLNLDSESRSFRADYAEKMMGDHRITQETIAYLAQHNVDMPLIKRIVAAVKVFLLKMGVKVRLAENDVVAIVIAAAKRAGTIARNKARDQASVDEVSGGIDETPGTAEYQSAVEKGLGMSKDSRMQRAVDMGAVTDLDSLYEQQTIKQGRELVSEGDKKSAYTSGNTRSAGAVAASPQLLFHGTADDVSGFAPGHRNRKDAGWLGRGTYLTDRHELANGYADLKRGDAAPNVMPLIAMLSNPYIATLEDKARLSRSPIAEVDAFTNDLKEQGYDGVILAYRDVKEIVVFDPAKVRSVHAAFDPDQADSRNLLFSKPKREYTPSQEAARKRGGFGLRKTTKLKTRFDELKYRATNKLRQGMVDQYDSFRSILDDNRAWMMSHLSSSYNGALEAVLEIGSIALKEDVITVDQSQKSLEEVLAPLGEELDDWLMWVAGNRSDRLATEGRERLFRDADIDALKSLADGVMDDGRHRPLVYETVRQDFEKLSQSINQVGVDTGLINQEEAQAWADQGFYLPFYRMVEETGDARGPRSFGNGLVRQTAYKKLTGADLQLDDLLTNLLMNWSHLLGASLKNQSAVAALDTAVEIGLAEQVDENEKGKNSVFVRKNGREVWYNIADDQDGALVFDSLVSLNQTPFNNLAMKGFRKFKRALTMGVTASPEFKLANLFRDTFQAIAVADMSTNIAKNLYQGFKATKKGHDTIAQMIAGGGAFGDSGYIHGADPDAVKLLIKKGISRDTILTPRVLMNVWDKWQDVGARLENVNRAANFEQALDDGKSLLEANFESRDHLDFSRTGTFAGIRFLAQVVPFLNARLQGLDKMGRAGMDKNQQSQFAAVITAYSAVSAMLYLYMKDDDDYKEAEEWERDSYHLFKLPGSDIMYRLPRPFEVGAIASMSERLVEQMVDDDVHGALFAERLGHTLRHTFAFDPTPQAVKPMLEIYANKNAFTGRPIESRSMKNLSPAERKRVWTSQTAVKTSAVMDSVVWDDVVLSPVQMEHLVRGYFGWLGTTALAGSDYIIGSAMDLPVKPAKKITDYPIVKRFARQGQGRSSKYITTFYERLNETTETFNDMKQARLDKDVDKQQSIYDDKAGVLRSRKRLSSVQRKLAKHRRQIASVHRSRSMTATEKRAEIDRLQAGMNAWAKVAVEDTNFNFQ